MSEEKFWIIQFSILCLVLIALIAGTSIYHIKKNNVILDLVKSGVPAELVTCALDDNHNSSPKCAVAAVINK